MGNPAMSTSPMDPVSLPLTSPYPDPIHRFPGAAGTMVPAPPDWSFETRVPLMRICAVVGADESIDVPARYQLPAVGPALFAPT